MVNLAATSYYGGVRFKAFILSLLLGYGLACGMAPSAHSAPVVPAEERYRAPVDSSGKPVFTTWVNWRTAA